MIATSIQSRVVCGDVGNSPYTMPPWLRTLSRAEARNLSLFYYCDPVLGDRDRGLFVHADIPPPVRDFLCPGGAFQRGWLKLSHDPRIGLQD
jgi:pyridoxal/pyridoxine/pyridoxamine kinase